MNKVFIYTCVASLLTLGCATSRNFTYTPIPPDGSELCSHIFVELGEEFPLILVGGSGTSVFAAQVEHLHVQGSVARALVVFFGKNQDLSPPVPEPAMYAGKWVYIFNSQEAYEEAELEYKLFAPTFNLSYFNLTNRVCNESGVRYVPLSSLAPKDQEGLWGIYDLIITSRKFQWNHYQFHPE